MVWTETSPVILDFTGFIRTRLSEILAGMGQFDFVVARNLIAGPVIRNKGNANRPGLLLIAVRPYFNRNNYHS